LIANAIDALEDLDWLHMHGKQPEISIQTRFEPSNQEIQVLISDNGPGMMPEVKRQLFDAFFTTKPASQGTGLGLAIARSIVVDRHGGQINCYSEPGQGTTFSIGLPIRQSTVSAPATLSGVS